MRLRAGPCSSVANPLAPRTLRSSKCPSSSPQQPLKTSAFFLDPNLSSFGRPVEEGQRCRSRSKRRKNGKAGRSRPSKKEPKKEKLVKPQDLTQGGVLCRTSSWTTIGRKRVVGVDGECSDIFSVPASSQQLGYPDRSPVASLSSNSDSECTPRKRIASPKTPLNPSIQASLAAVDEEMEYGGDSLLESLPFDLLVRIVCCLQHDELKPVFHVCTRLRKAVSVARLLHFNFTTPDRERKQTLGPLTLRDDENWKTASEAGFRPPTPKAPRQLPKPSEARIPFAELIPVAPPLFQDYSSPLLNPRKASRLPRVIVRGVASHRVLFNEEELCKAVSQNSI